MNRPAITDATPEEAALARRTVRRALDAAIIVVADELNDQPLSIKQLMAKLLVEDFAALDPNAAQNWLAAAAWEIEPLDDDTRAQAITNRLDAFTALANAEIARGAA